ncbi:hypothetical protein [Capnocytophaga canimorsus]|uniref:hypothetical protein n=1 Tax=Capnocytophaga canimorsus TaxID=28188 RepID=UPI001BB44319|nr:hypothetical protein [Capnocytophaga canimorsus]
MNTLRFKHKVEIIKKHFKNNSVRYILDKLEYEGYFLYPDTNILSYDDIVPFGDDIMLSETDICEVNRMSDKIDEQPIEFIDFLYNLVK